MNPYDREGLAEAIHQAVTMEPKERRRRMGRLREKIRQQDVFWWVDAFLKASSDRGLEHFPEADLPPLVSPRPALRARGGGAMAGGRDLCPLRLPPHP